MAVWCLSCLKPSMSRLGSRRLAAPSVIGVQLRLVEDVPVYGALKCLSIAPGSDIEPQKADSVAGGAANRTLRAVMIDCPGNAAPEGEAPVLPVRVCACTRSAKHRHPPGC
jgi:hypothetical protein